MKNILPILADIANGVFATLLASYCTNTEVLWWHILIGVAFAMFPDLDALQELWKRGKIAASNNNPKDHRDGLHYPILFLGIGVFLGVYFGFFGWMFLFGTMLHFVNDLYGTGWGIQLFWPLSKRRYKVLGSRVNQPVPLDNNDGGKTITMSDDQKEYLVVSWSEDELPEYIKRFGFDTWIDDIYLTVNWISVTEYSLFAIALVLIIFTLLY